MKRKLNTTAKILLGLVFLLLISMLLMIPTVASKVGSVVGKSASTLMSIAQTTAVLVLGVMLITWGISALAIPWLGGAMIIAGLGMLVYELYPLLTANSSSSGS